MPTPTKRSIITAAIEKLDHAIAGHDENVAEAAAMFAEGKLSQADLDGHIKARDELIARRKAMHDALQAAAAKDAHTEAADVEAAKDAAEKQVADLAPLAVKAAAEADKAADAFAAAVARVREINDRIARHAFNAGMRGDARRHLLSVRFAGEVLADRIVGAGLDHELDTLGIVNRPSVAPGAKFADIARSNFERLTAGINHARRG